MNHPQVEAQLESSPGEEPGPRALTSFALSSSASVEADLLAMRGDEPAEEEVKD